MTKYFKTYIILLMLTLVSSACRDDVDFNTSDDAGQDVTVRVALGLPDMQVLSRADLEDYQINQIQSVWIRTYSATGAGRATMDQWLEIEGKTLNPHELQPATLDTKSGPTYIVAVANVEGAQGVTKDDLTERPLADLLESADTWQDFLDIAVAAPSDYYDINEPPTPLVMAGCFIADDTDHPSVEGWQTTDFTPYDIQPTGTGVFTLNGVIHLRRIVSQITFNLIPDKGISVTPNSYRVFNAPVYSWLYERDASRQANFGDAAATADDAAKYYTTTDIYPGTSFEDGDIDGSYRFSFWQAENKHRGKDSCRNYNDRQIKTGTADAPLFTSLTGSTWTPDNMATYVVINCSVDHIDQIKVDGDGNEDKTNGNNVYRSGNASYIVHLGYLDGVATDFNAYRNTKYTYNVHIAGVDQIRVEAFKEGDTNGVEGLVTDVLNPTYLLDCHYHAYNIELTATDLVNFGFITSTYDGGVAHTYQDIDFEGTDRPMTAKEKEYIAWVELRPTSDATTLADYKPATGENADGATSNLLDVSRGLTDKQKSKTGWYTVFVNEYTYEGTDGKESGTNWQRYVNQPSRRFYIRVTREISNDGYSLYARSKYAGIQRSIQTYYSNREVPSGGVLGAEHENEAFGLNVSRTYTYANNEVNGRYNVWMWLNNITSGKAPTIGAASKKWEDVIRPHDLQHIYAVNDKQGITINEHDATLPSLAYGKAVSTANNEMLPQGAITDGRYWIEAVNACMNRNRDNNGNGQIDPEELRWYVPARGKYLRLVLGDYSLTTPMADFDAVPQLKTEKKDDGKGDGKDDGKGGSGDVALKDCTRLMMFTSDGTAIMTFNGTSSSLWFSEEYTDIASTPWDVRCVRNLGTDLSTVDEEDKTVPAYVHNEATRTVSMTYYDVNSYRRGESFSGNGTADGQMPVHIINNERYNRPFAKFQYSEGRYGLSNGPKSRYDGVINSGTLLNDVIDKINNDNPCGSLGEGWRLPNISELSIMRNLGLFDDFYSGQYKDRLYIISCTKSYYDSKGYGFVLDPSTERNLLGVVYDNTMEIPTSLPYLGYDPNKGQVIFGDKRTLERNAYYRCVRDVR